MKWPAIVAVALLVLPSIAQPATRPSFLIGRIEHPPIKESSGLVESRTQPGVFWTINDSGNEPVLYAIDRTGKLLAEFPVDAPNHDWEDLAADDAGHLYIPDIGNNSRKRTELPIYQIAEPKLSEKHAGKLAVLRTWRITYTDKPFDTEGFFVFQGKGYLVSKVFDARKARLYAFDLEGDGEIRPMKEIATLPIRTPVTGADLSPDAKWLAVITPTGPTVFQVNGDLTSLPKAPSHSVLHMNGGMEAIALVKEGVIVTSEDRSVLRFTWEQLKSRGVLIEKE